MPIHPFLPQVPPLGAVWLSAVPKLRGSLGYRSQRTWKLKQEKPLVGARDSQGQLWKDIPTGMATLFISFLGGGIYGYKKSLFKSNTAQSAYSWLSKGYPPTHHHPCLIKGHSQGGKYLTTACQLTTFVSYWVHKTGGLAEREGLSGREVPFWAHPASSGPTSCC